MYEKIKFSELEKKTFDKVIKLFDIAIIFVDAEYYYIQYHNQSCCEHVSIEDICGDLEDLVNTPIVQSEETSSKHSEDENRSETWTFYRMSSRKGGVVIRWYGSSNGWYSERAELVRISKKYSDLTGNIDLDIDEIRHILHL